MPKWNLPPIKRKRDEEKEEVLMPAMGDRESFPSAWERQIRVPCSPEILAALQVGAEAEVSLKGVISGLSSDKHSAYLTIDIEQVEAYGESDPEEDMEEGFKRGPKGLMTRRY